MFIGGLLTVVATFIQAFSPRRNLGCFIAGRVLIGIGQGMALTAGPVCMGEMAPPHIRGVIMAFWQLFYSVGSFTHTGSTIPSPFTAVLSANRIGRGLTRY
ncbi:hypothetical protein HDV63DRAFT_383924, partial [Trichoderma sp. SZMC 28014]